MPTAMPQRNSLKKEERLSSLTTIDRLFAGEDSRKATAFPLRAVFFEAEKTARLPRHAILVSVPKRRFRHAVDRNRIKRQVREAYRLNKAILAPLEESHPGKAVAVAFVYLSASHTPSAELHRRVRRLLHAIVEQLLPEQANPSAQVKHGGE